VARTRGRGKNLFHFKEKKGAAPGGMAFPFWSRRLSSKKGGRRGWGEGKRKARLSKSPYGERRGREIFFLTVLMGGGGGKDQKGGFRGKEMSRKKAGKKEWVDKGKKTRRSGENGMKERVPGRQGKALRTRGSSLGENGIKSRWREERWGRDGGPKGGGERMAFARKGKKKKNPLFGPQKGGGKQGERGGPFNEKTARNHAEGEEKLSPC